jgi:hypothetical protein
MIYAVHHVYDRVCQKYVPEALDFNKTDAERPFTSFLGLSNWHAMCRLTKVFSAVHVYTLPGTTLSVTGGALTE